MLSCAECLKSLACGVVHFVLEGDARQIEESLVAAEHSVQFRPDCLSITVDDIPFTRRGATWQEAVPDFGTVRKMGTELENAVKRELKDIEADLFWKALPLPPREGIGLDFRT